MDNLVTTVTASGASPNARFKGLLGEISRRQKACQHNQDWKGLTTLTTEIETQSDDLYALIAQGEGQTTHAGGAGHTA